MVEETLGGEVEIGGGGWVEAVTIGGAVCIRSYQHNNMSFGGGLLRRSGELTFGGGGGGEGVYREELFPGGGGERVSKFAARVGHVHHYMTSVFIPMSSRVEKVPLRLLPFMLTCEMD